VSCVPCRVGTRPHTLFNNLLSPAGRLSVCHWHVFENVTRRSKRIVPLVAGAYRAGTIRLSPCKTGGALSDGNSSTHIGRRSPPIELLQLSLGVGDSVCSSVTKGLPPRSRCKEPVTVMFLRWCMIAGSRTIMVPGEIYVKWSGVATVRYLTYPLPLIADPSKFNRTPMNIFETRDD